MDILNKVLDFVKPILNTILGLFGKSVDDISLPF